VNPSDSLRRGTRSLSSSAAGNANVGHIPWKAGPGDVVQAYADAFRDRGLLPGLYDSVWDTTQGVEADSLTAADVAYVESPWAAGPTSV
jgi:alpha-L-fucosidase